MPKSTELTDPLWTKAEQVAYAIPGNETGGRLIVYGNKAAKNVLLCCAGFPDNVHALMPLASKLADQNDCLVGVACMPGYDVHHENWKPEGYTFDEMAVSLQEATKVLKGLSTGKDAQLTGVFHDWGCAVGSMTTNRMNKDQPGTYSKIIYFDILPNAHKSHKLEMDNPLSYKSLVSFSYSSCLAISYAINRYVSGFLAGGFFTLGFVVLNMLGLTPTGKLDNDTMNNRKEPKYSLSKIAYMSYPYYQMYTGGMKSLVRGFHLPTDLEKTPVLYMYGLNKNINFHDTHTLEWMKKEAEKEGNKSKIVPVDKAGHWLYLHQPQICYDEAQKFVFDS